MAKSRLPVVDLDYSSDIRQIAVTPLAEGQLKVTVNDLCLEVDGETSADVFVASMYSIQVTVADKVQVGNWIIAFVKVLDNRQMPFPATQHRYV